MEGERKGHRSFAVLFFFDEVLNFIPGPPVLAEGVLGQIKHHKPKNTEAFIIINIRRSFYISFIFTTHSLCQLLFEVYILVYVVLTRAT